MRDWWDLTTFNFAEMLSVLNVLRHWREQREPGTKVFALVAGFQAAWEKILKRASISHFRWHDLRHHFASRLVQRGVPLNTVRDLLGHSSVQMSLRFAHLAPDQRREAVAKRMRNRLLPLLCAYQEKAFKWYACIPLISMVEREGLEPSTPAL